MAPDFPPDQAYVRIVRRSGLVHPLSDPRRVRPRSPAPRRRTSPKRRQPVSPRFRVSWSRPRRSRRGSTTRRSRGSASRLRRTDRRVNRAIGGPFLLHDRGRWGVVDGRSVHLGARRRRMGCVRECRGRVIDSARAVLDDTGVARPIAVLVQRQLCVAIGGVLFGVDPVTGDRDHVVVEAVPGRPDVLVGGTALADHYVLSRRGRIVQRTRQGAMPALDGKLRRSLAKWRGAPSVSSVHRRTSNGASTRPATSGCCRAGRSPRWRAATEVSPSCSDPGRSPRRSRPGCDASRRTCGSGPFATAYAGAAHRRGGVGEGARPLARGDHGERVGCCRSRIVRSRRRAHHVASADKSVCDRPRLGTLGASGVFAWHSRRWPRRSCHRSTGISPPSHGSTKSRPEASSTSSNEHDASWPPCIPMRC